MLRKYTNTKEGVTHPGKTCAASGRERSSPRSSWRPGCNWKACRSTKRPSAASRPGSGWWRIMSCSIWQRFCGCAWKTCLGWNNAADFLEPGAATVKFTKCSWDMGRYEGNLDWAAIDRTRRKGYHRVKLDSMSNLPRFWG